MATMTIEQVTGQGVAEHWDQCLRETNGDIRAYARRCRRALAVIDWGNGEHLSPAQLDEAERVIVRDLEEYRDRLGLFDVDRYVHQLPSGRWVVAYWDERSSQWYAPVTARERAVTGCHTYYAGSLEALGCTSYVSRRAAVDRARKLYGPPPA